MTAVAERPAPPAPQQEAPAGKSRRQRIDAVTILTVYVVLLMAIPAALVVAPLGAVGGPAIIFAAVVFVFYLVTWLHPALAPQHFRQPVRAAAILFACAIIATYVSVNRHIMPSLERNGADRGLILIFGWLGILLMASDGIVSMERLKKLLGRIVILGTFMASLGITQFFTGLDATKYIIIPGLTAQAPTTDLLSRNGLNRPAATAAHPLEFAAVLAMVLPIAINRARFAPRELRVRRWLQVALIGAALPMTVSKAAVLALAVVCLVLLPTWPKLERRIAYVVMLFGVVALWFLVPGLLSTFRTLFATLTGDSSTTSRTSAFSTAMPYIAQHPWLGHGFGTFFPATYFFTDDQYLLSLIEIGVVGVLALLGLFITGLVTARKVRHATTNPEIRDLGQCLTATIAVSMVTFATFDALSFGMAAGLTFVFLGCAGAALRLVRTQGVPADGHLLGPPVAPPGQGPPALTHQPRPDESAGAGALYGVTGLRAGRQSNGHASGPDEKQPAEKPSEQSNGHLPPPAGQQLEQPAAPRQEEQAGAQMEQLIGRYLGERTTGKPEQQADGHPAEPAEEASERPAEAAPERPAEAASERPAGAAPEEPAQAQAGKSYWDNQLWPWEPQDLQPAPRPKEEPAKAREEEQPAKDSREEPAQARQEEAPQEEQPAKEQVEQPEAQVEQPEAHVEQPEAHVEQPEAHVEQPEAHVEQPEAHAEQPEAHAEQPEAHAEQPEAHAEVADLPIRRPTVQAEVPELPAGSPTVQAEVPELPGGSPTVQAEVPDLPAGPPTMQAEVPDLPIRRPPAQMGEAGLPIRRPEARPEQPLAGQPEQSAARAGQPAEPQAERAAEAPWNPWRKPERPTAQPAAAAADEPAGASAGQPSVEPAEARAERPAEAPWDPWRKPGVAAGQPTTDEQAAADQPSAEPIRQPSAEAAGEQTPEPAEPPAPEPPGERPEESTIPIPIIRD